MVFKAFQALITFKKELIEGFEVPRHKRLLPVKGR